MQPALFDNERALLDQLLAESKLYRSSAEFAALMQFVVRLRAFAPFNAMLLNIQKPGLSYAATRADWLKRFNRTVKEKARPLLILMPMRPVVLVYDVVDTEGDPLPRDVATFWARGEMDIETMSACIHAANSNGITCKVFDGGDRSAGQIRVTWRPNEGNGRSHYEMYINANHPVATQFITLAHELAHLALGHLGEDKRLKIKDRRWADHATQELEAELVAVLVAARNGITGASESYLASFVQRETDVAELGVYLIMKAAGKVEELLKLKAQAPAE